MKRFGLIGWLVMIVWTAGAHERRIDTWLVAGPFPNIQRAGFDKDHLNGEAEAAPSLGAEAGGKRWTLMDDRVYCRNQDDYVDLSTWFMPRRKGAPAGGNEQVLAYAHVYVWSPAAKPAFLWVGASDGFKAWLNGKPVALLEPDERQPIRDQYKFPVSLAAGWNRLLLKSANDYRIWGFYAKLGDAEGRPMHGLEYSVDAPGGKLDITTPELPKGYTGWPYIWLTVTGVKPLHSVPSASPFRLIAKGGKPPYAWSVGQGGLPPGLSLDAAEGELLGTCGEKPGVWPVTFQVTDAAGAMATAALTLAIAERPTKWYEEGKIGGLIHGSPYAQPPYGVPARQAELLAREGYVWAAPTAGYYPDPATWPGWYDPKLKAELKGFTMKRHDELMAALRARSVGFGSYLAPPDAIAYVYPNPRSTNLTDYPHWPRYLDNLQQYFEEWCADTHPVVVYLDGTGFPAPIMRIDPYDPRNKGYDLDALYSMAKTVSPSTLIIANGQGSPCLDWRLGDCDVFSTEGMNDWYNPVWDRWPMGQSGHYPKRIPNESWRYPFTHEKWGDYVKNWREWTVSLVSMIGEGRLINLDHSAGQGREAMHEKIGDWLAPRLESLKGTRPGPILDTPWGYCVQGNGTVFLHCLANKRGKTGIVSGVTELSLEPMPRKVKVASLLPDGKPLAFAQEGARVTISIEDVKPDPIDTIIRLECTKDPEY